MRTFERTHSWITFRCDLGKVGAELWLALGEAASKCEHRGERFIIKLRECKNGPWQKLAKELEFFG
jgi:hypothetical protein